jgi:hypothetical protein
LSLKIALISRSGAWFVQNGWLKKGTGASEKAVAARTQPDNQSPNFNRIRLNS